MPSTLRQRPGKGSNPKDKGKNRKDSKEDAIPPPRVKYVRPKGIAMYAATPRPLAALAEILSSFSTASVCGSVCVRVRKGMCVSVCACG